VCNHDILAAADAGVDGIEGNGGGVRPGVATDEIGSRAPGPGSQLIDRSGPEGVGGAHQHRHLIRLEQLGKLPDERSLAGSIHSDHEHHGRS